MRIFYITALVVAAVNASIVSASDQKTTVKLDPVAGEKKVTVEAPFKNHWDAKTWEADNDNFWKSTTKETKDDKTRD